MIIITRTATKEVIHKLADGTKVFRNWNNIIIDNTDFIYDLNDSNTTVYEGVSDTPGDFDGGKYLYDGSWSANPDYIEPTPENLAAMPGIGYSTP